MCCWSRNMARVNGGQRPGDHIEHITDIIPGFR